MSDEHKHTEYEFKDEMGAFERAAVGGHTHIGTEATRDPLTRFTGKIEAISNTLDLRELGIDVDFMKEKAGDLSNDDKMKFEYLNVYAFVLGYIMYDEIKKNPHMTSSLTAFELYEDNVDSGIYDYGVEKPDIIRYFKYWKTITND